MTSAALFFRTFCPVVCCFLLLVYPGGVGGSSFRNEQPPFGNLPPRDAAVSSGSAQVLPALPSSGEVTAAAGVEPLPRRGAPSSSPRTPRSPRTSRFTTRADSAYRTGILAEDTTWRGQVLVEGALTVAPSVTLVIAPGTTVRFRPSPEGNIGMLLIRGRLQATGTSDQPIVFASDEINPTAGDWQGILILDSSKKNLLEWCRIEGAVAGVAAEFSDVSLRQTSVSRSRTGVAFRSSTVVVSGGGITECPTGLFSRDGDTDLSGGIFSGNGVGIAVTGGSLYLSASQVTGSTGNGLQATGARLRLEGNRFSGNGTGVMLAGCRGDLVGSRIESNRGMGLELLDSPLGITGNRISGNGAVGVMVRSGGGTLWDNTLEKNGEGELTVAGTEDIAAPANWWGSGDPVRIRERIRDAAGGRVLFTPYLESPPSL